MSLFKEAGPDHKPDGPPADGNTGRADIEEDSPVGMPTDDRHRSEQAGSGASEAERPGAKPSEK